MTMPSAHDLAAANTEGRSEPYAQGMRACLVMHEEGRHGGIETCWTQGTVEWDAFWFGVSDGHAVYDQARARYLTSNAARVLRGTPG